MARMSIDDSVLRDPRVSVLARLCGWSRRETLGALLDVWAICYDKVTDVLPAEHIEVTTGHADFAAHMITASLASECENGVSVKGVKQRIGYLQTKTSAGRRGGLKSGESRRESAKHKHACASTTPQAPPNPIPIVPDPAPDPVPDPAPDVVVVVVPDRQSAPPDGDRATPPTGDPLPGDRDADPIAEPLPPDCHADQVADQLPCDHDSAPIAVLPPSEVARRSAPGAARQNRAHRAHPLPAGWCPGRDELALAKTLGVPCDREADAFRDHHSAKGTRFVDWQAAFRNWLRNAVKFNRGNARPDRPSFFEILDSLPCEPATGVPS